MQLTLHLPDPTVRSHHVIIQVEGGKGPSYPSPRVAPTFPAGVKALGLTAFLDYSG